MIELEQKVLSPLRERGAKIWLFGSRARGTFQQFSDIDLMVESDEDLGELIGELKELMENSSFPFKVDLVELKHFAKSYRDNFEREKTLL